MIAGDINPCLLPQDDGSSPTIWDADVAMIGYAAEFATIMREVHGENAPFAIADTLYAMSVGGNLNPEAVIFLAMTLGMLFPVDATSQTVHRRALSTRSVLRIHGGIGSWSSGHLGRRSRSA